MIYTINTIIENKVAVKYIDFRAFFKNFTLAIILYLYLHILGSLLCLLLYILYIQNYLYIYLKAYKNHVFLGGCFRTQHVHMYIFRFIF